MNYIISLWTQDEQDLPLVIKNFITSGWSTCSPKASGSPRVNDYFAWYAISPKQIVCPVNREEDKIGRSNTSNCGHSGWQNSRRPRRRLDWKVSTNRKWSKKGKPSGPTFHHSKQRNRGHHSFSHYDWRPCSRNRPLRHWWYWRSASRIWKYNGRERRSWWIGSYPDHCGFGWCEVYSRYPENLRVLGNQGRACHQL